MKDRGSCLAMTLVFLLTMDHPHLTTVFAADGVAPLILPQLLEEVKRVNPNLLVARKRWEAAQAKVPLATGLPAPRIGVEFEEIPRGTVKLNQATIMYQLIQSLPFPGKLSLRQKVAVKEAQMAAASFKQAEWEVVSELKRAYYDLFLVERELTIGEAELLWLKQAEASALARYATGTISQGELLRIQAEALEASNRLDVLTHRRQALAAHLNHLLNRPAETLVGSSEEVPLMAVPSDPKALFAQAQEQQPELLMFKFSAERAEAEWKLKKRELLPDLETMVELRDPTMGPVGPWDLTLALVLPFWFWTKERYGVKAALYDKESAEAAFSAMQNEVNRRIHEHWHEAQAAYLTASLSEEGLIPMAQQAVASALAGYRGGKGSLMEFLEAVQNFNERQRSYYENLVQLEQHLVLLEQTVGVPLRERHETATEGARGQTPSGF